MTEHKFLSWLGDHRESVRTPAYIYGEETLDASLSTLTEVFPPGVRVFYSLKANPQPEVVRYLARRGVGGEIASAGEGRLCALAGLLPGDILVGGVAKSREYLASVCEQSMAGIVIDSPAEWTRLRAVLSRTAPVRIFLRINPGLSLGGLDMAGESQFGLAPEQAFAMARECDQAPQVEFAGLHFYFGSQRLSVDPIVKMVEVAGEVLNRFADAGLRVEVVDLGLGCGVPYLEKDAELSMADVREQLRPQWNRSPWTSVRLWTEAGRALVGRAGFFVARVLEKKRLHGKVFVYLDGGLQVHNPGVGLGRFFRSNPRFGFVRGSTPRDAEPTEQIEIVGNLCTSADSLGHRVPAPVLAEGDLVVIPNAGAYCQTTALWGFNSQPLFTEAFLTRDGTLRPVDAQYRVQLGGDVPARYSSAD